MPILTFLAQIEAAVKTGQATEHTYRPAMQKLLETLMSPAKAINEPKQESYGAPDFVVQQGETPIGHVEAKDVDIDLGKIIADSELANPRTSNGKQLKRYRAALPNLLFTNCLEWHWFVHGQPRLDAPVQIASLNKSKKKLTFTNPDDLADLLQQFAAQQVPTIDKPRDLADRLAKTAHWLCDVLGDVFKGEGAKGELHAQLEAFRNTLLPSITPDEFADMYAQTIVYGLFAARVAVPDKPDFSRYDAAQAIPKTNPFVRSLFQRIAVYDLDERIAWLVDHCAALLARTDMEAVLKDFGKATMQHDPVVHFYETFLAAYDPKMREARGVYYTPEPVVSYIVRSVDLLLRERFNKPDGLADGQTVILDPATGTATFLHAVVQRIYETLHEQGLAGYWNSYVPEKLLPRLFGFELLVAPYTMAHMKLDLLLKEHGYQFESNERLGIYLTNALESLPTDQHYMGFEQFIATEGAGADQVKREQPVMVVLGNPPYSGHSENKSEWIAGLVRDYYQVDGKPLGERNPKWLQDDYVKFLRFGQWRIHQTGEGVLAFISNNGYLDNPTFRGMRQSLLHEFDTIYLLNLHGNSKKKERAPDGSPDENVFDIQQGVTIGIFIKQSDQQEQATVYYADLWGEREGKYESLMALDVSSTEWQQIEPTSPWYLFVPQSIALSEEYLQGWKITDIMPVHSAGIVTARDHLTIQWSRKQMVQIARDFASLSTEEAREKYSLGDDVRDWKVSLAQGDIRSEPTDDKKIIPLFYRPFDQRYTYYTGQTRGFLCMPRPATVYHLLNGDTMSIAFSRSTSPGRPFDHIFCMRHTILARFFTDSACTTYFAPLYLYPNGSEHPTLFDYQDGRRPNLSADFIKDIEQRLGLAFVPDGAGDLVETVGPEDIFHSIYAVFHSPTYRERYAEFLKLDFPRVPLTSDRALFAALAAKGAELVDLHLLRLPGAAGVGGAGGAAILQNPQQQGVLAPGHGDNLVEKVRYVEPQGDQAGRVYFNKEQFFGGIEPETWAMQIGGYQPLEKWLKDRKGRVLGIDDIQHYRRVVVALRETRRIMQEIDAMIPAWPVA